MLFFNYTTVLFILFSSFLLTHFFLSFFLEFLIDWRGGERSEDFEMRRGERGFEKLYFHVCKKHKTACMQRHKIHKTSFFLSFWEVKRTRLLSLRLSNTMMMLKPRRNTRAKEEKLVLIVIVFQSFAHLDLLLYLCSLDLDLYLPPPLR